MNKRHAEILSAAADLTFGRQVNKRHAEILSAAADLISRVGWTKGWYARDLDGNKCNPENPGAAAFCAVGAVMRVSHCDHHIGHDITNRWVARIIETGLGVHDWNDTSTMTAAEVCSTLRAAASLAMGEDS